MPCRRLPSPREARNRVTRAVTGIGASCSQSGGLRVQTAGAGQFRRVNAAGYEQRIDTHARRAGQNARWMWAMVLDRLEEAFRTHPEVAPLSHELERQVRA